MMDAQRYEDFKRYVISTMYPGPWWAEVVRTLPAWRVHEIYKKYLDDLRDIYRSYKEQ